MSRARIGVLLVGNNHAGAQKIQGLLAEAARKEPDGPRYKLTPADNLAQALEILPRGGITVVLLDLTLSDNDPLEALSQILAVDPSLPVLIMMDEYDQTLILQGLQAGAQEYLIKENLSGDLLLRQMHIAIERKRIALGPRNSLQEDTRLYADEQQRTTYLVALQRLGIELAILHDERSVVDTLAVRAATQMGNYDCAVVLIDPGDKQGILSAQFGLPDGVQMGTRFSLASSRMQRSLATGEPFFTSDIQRDLPDLWPIFRTEAQAVFIYPMMWQANATGFIGLSSPSARMPSPEEITAFQLLAERAAAALENARLFEETHRHAEQLAVVNGIGQEIMRLTDIQDILDIAVKLVVEKLGYYSSAIFLLQDDRLVFEAGYDWSRQSFHQSYTLSFGQGIIGYVAQTGKPYLAADVSSDPHYIFHEGLPETRSELAVPIHGSERFLGVIDIQSQTAGQLDETDQQVLEAVAGQCANALDNAHLFAEIRHRLDELEAINKISTSLRSAQTLEEMLPVLLDRTLEVLGASAGMISLYDAFTHELHPAALRGWFCQAFDADVPSGQSLMGHAFTSGMIFLTDDLASDPRTQLTSLLNIPQGWAGACLPIRSIHETVGELFVSVQSPRVFTEDDVHLLTTLAEIAGNAIHRTSLHEQLEHRAEELHARNLELARLYRAAGSLVAGVTLDTQAMAKAIVETILQEFGQVNCSLVLVQEESQDLLRLVVSGPYADQLNRRKLTLQGPGLLSKAIRTGQVINVPDVSASPDYIGNWPAARSELTIPLKIGSGVIGAIDLQSKELNAFNASDEHLLSIFAERAALALANARLYEQTMRSLQRLTAFRTIDQAISSSMDLRVTLNILLDQVISQLGVDAAAILLYNPESMVLEYAAVRGFRSRKIEHSRLRLNEGNAGRVALERRPIQMVVLPEMAEAVTRLQPFVGENFVSYYGLPLIAKGQLRGVLEILHHSPLSPDQDWLDFVETLARQAAIALDSVALFDNIQRSNSELTLAYDAAIESWSQALELRSPFQKGHALRTAETTVRLGRAMKVSEVELVHARRGALLHDIGEVAIPESILQKEGALSEEEWQIVRQHPVVAFELLSPIRYLQLASDIPHCHHERWDGKGYPRGLAGDQIPLLARIFAVADAWDALRSDRPYRPAWTREMARDYIRDQAGKCFDPLVVETFMTLPDL
jgi:GAF domain-containing protein/CheY-like chemotaxis protein